MKILYVGLLALTVACNSNGPSDLPIPPDPSGFDDVDHGSGYGSGSGSGSFPSVDWTSIQGDLIPLHVSSSGMFGGDLDDAGEVLVFSDAGWSGNSLYRKNLSTLVIEDLGSASRQKFLESNPSGYFYNVHNGWAASGGLDYSYFHIDQDGDYSYFAASGHDGERTSTILYRKGATGEAEVVKNLGHSTMHDKRSITKSGNYFVFASDLHPLDNNLRTTGIANLYRLNTLTGELDAITNRVPLEETERNHFYVNNPTVSDDGEHILYNVADLQQNIYNMPVVSATGVRNALVYQKLGATPRTILLNSVERFPGNDKFFTNPKISSNGLYATFEILDTASSGKQIWHFDSTQSNDGEITLISKNEADQQVMSNHPYGALNICDISPDGKLVGIISNNMQFIGQNRESGPHLFIKNIETKSVQLISAKANGDELPGNVLTCKFVDQGRAIIFTIQPNHSFTRIIFKKSLSE
jgi:hypothetical protein